HLPRWGWSRTRDQRAQPSPPPGTSPAQRLVDGGSHATAPARPNPTSPQPRDRYGPSPSKRTADLDRLTLYADVRAASGPRVLSFPPPLPSGAAITFQRPDVAYICPSDPGWTLPEWQ